MLSSARRFRQPLILGAVGAACFVFGCVMNLLLAAIAGRELPRLTDPASLLPMLFPLLDALVLVAFLHVSMTMGWRHTRIFWITVISTAACAWLLSDFAPIMVARHSEWWTALLAWSGPVAIVVLVLAVVAQSRQRAAQLLVPVQLLVQAGGAAAWMAAAALPLRIGLIAYSIPHGPSRTLASETRLQHVTAPGDYAALANPFESPEYSIVLEQAGPELDAVHQIVQGAVANRTAERARELVSNTPSVVREVVDRDLAHELAASLRAAGAACSVRETLDVFLDQVKADAPTPIGRPSQVLDLEYLDTRRDAIADLRQATARDSDSAVDHELLKRAYVAFATAQGRALYQIHCRACHGTKGSGDGPMAGGFLLRPANFRDPQGISMLQPGEVLWRIEEGAAALPPEATPWHSSMPAWKHELDRELIWKIILGEFHVANTRPASRGAVQHAHRQRLRVSPVERPTTIGWLQWPVPPAPAAQQMQDAEFIRRGAYLYYFRCMPCHGVTGRGDGPAADTMWPRPRDFTTENFAIETPQPKFKFRTTKQGWLPTDQDLYRTISRGLAGTAMEGWDGVMSPAEIWQVIAYLKTLSPAWNDPEHIARNPNDPVVVKEFTELDGSVPTIDYERMRPPPVTPALVDEGRDIFLKFRCYECHGIEARGDGLALGQHYDDWGYRMWPQNLAKAFNYKAGHAIKDIYRTFANRLDGTVMPVYSAKTLDPQHPVHGEHLQWALASHVSSQVQPESEAATSGNTVIASRLTGDLPSDPLDATWETIPKSLIPLTGQVLVAPRWTAPAVSQVAVRAAVNSQAVAIWLQWDDRRPNVTHQDVPVDFSKRIPGDPALGPTTYAAPALRPNDPIIFAARDQVQIQLPHASLGQSDRPVSERPMLLYASQTTPTLLWRWSADRQGLTVTKQAEEIAGGMTERLECTADETEGHDRALDFFTARGPEATLEPITLRPIAQSRAHWSNGAWTLVMSCSPFASEQFIRGEQPMPMTIHIWDGLAGEADLRMAISSWIDLVSIPARPVWHHIVALLLALSVVAAEFWVARLYRTQLHRS